MNTERKIELTSDGSCTLYVPQLDEHYHSVKGAVTESRHIFIGMGLESHPAEAPVVLEIGFGTGLNAFLAWLWAESEHRKVDYTTIERYPVESELLASLDYPSIVAPDRSGDFEELHRAAWDEKVKLSACFSLYKRKDDFTKLTLPKEAYDVVFFDAFAPEKQPEMWTQPIFDNLYAAMRDGGFLVTYCAKGVVRRMLQEAGFKTERLSGPPGGKREILRAVKMKE